MAITIATGKTSEVRAHREASASRAYKRTRRFTAALWTAQGLLAAVFLMSGSMKLALPVDALLASMPVPLPIPFVRFLGMCEVLGSLGMVLPGLFRIRTELTPLAASGLVIIMTGATVITLATGGGVAALVTLVIGVLAGFVAYGRRTLAPQSR
jgi:uncharacterized membrane protein YphA (DoxX/SURF4 family)